MDRTILHCDCNCFYASVECALKPELKSVPMAVGGDVESRHGIILAKNEAAKGFDIITGETVGSARHKCPGLVVVPPHHEIYAEYSRRINAMYAEYTDLVEKFGLDESFLDVTHSRRLFGDGKTIADTLRKRIREEIGITISVGVSFNKVFAKLGSDLKKPDATTCLLREDFKQKIYPLPVNMLLYVGKSTYDRLYKADIKTIGELAAADKKRLERMLGKQGIMLWEYANGLDSDPVKPIDAPEEIKSIGNSCTYKRNLVGLEDIRVGVSMLSDKIAARMRKKGLKCTTVQITLRDPEFKTITRQTTLAYPTSLSREISRAALELIEASWDIKKPIRMLGVSGSKLVAADGAVQLSLFENPDEKSERLESAIDTIRQRYGTPAITRASIIGSDIGTD